MTQLTNKLKHPTSTRNQIGRYTVTLFFVLLTHFFLSQIPHLFNAHSLLVQLALSAVVLVAVTGLGGWLRRVVGFRASAPAFVFFNTLFIWGVYISFVRKAVPLLMDVVFNLEVLFIIVGHCRISTSDPGLVMDGPSCLKRVVGSTSSKAEALYESSFPGRVRYCKSCDAYVKGFDHHCPAFGNCIGQNNHVLFLVLLSGFLITEASYIIVSSQFTTISQFSVGILSKTTLSEDVVASTMLFSVLQVLWQGIFLTWHIYCICFNIRTEEWINWKNYPEFQLLDQLPAGQTPGKIRFMNPYDKGLVQNMKEFMLSNS